MARPKHGYTLRDGTKVVGVTTVLGRFKESGGLLQWAFQQGKSGAINLYDARDTAADIGTLAHELVEQHIDRPDMLVPDAVALSVQKIVSVNMAEKALTAFRAYLTWESSFKLTVVAQEMPLVSERYRFGGTPDAVGFVQDQLCIIDWKSSKAVYRDYLLQLAAYKQLWEENHPTEPITGGFHLLRFGKDEPDFEHRYFGNLDEAWLMFEHLLAAYEIDKRLKNRVA